MVLPSCMALQNKKVNGCSGTNGTKRWIREKNLNEIQM
jgi:hypothetical protein